MLYTTTIRRPRIKFHLSKGDKSYTKICKTEHLILVRTYKYNNNGKQLRIKVENSKTQTRQNSINVAKCPVSFIRPHGSDRSKVGGFL